MGKEGTSYWVRDYLLDVKVNGKPLFIAIEQGVGKHSKNVIVILNPIYKIEVRKWIIKEYGITVKVEGKEIYLTIFLPYKDKQELSY